MADSHGQITRADLYKAAVLGAGALVLFWILANAIDRIIPILELFTIGLLISLALNRPLLWLEKHRVPRIASLAILFVLVAGLLSFSGYLLIPALIDQATQFVNDGPQYWSETQDWINRLGRRYPSFTENLNVQYWGQRTTERIFQILTAVRSLAAGAASFVLLGIALLFIVIFTILNPGPLINGALSLLPPRYVGDAKQIIGEIADKLIAWVQGTLITMVSIGVMSWLALTIIGVDYPVLFGIIAGLLEVIPTIGPVLSAIPPVLVALTTSPIQALYVIIAYIIVQQAESNLLVPYVMSAKLRLHPLSILFSLLVLASFLGIFGAAIAAPVAATVKVLYESIYLNRIRPGMEQLPEPKPEEKHPREDTI